MLSMVIDHIGSGFLNNNLLMQSIGRLSFILYAFGLFSFNNHPWKSLHFSIQDPAPKGKIERCPDYPSSVMFALGASAVYFAEKMMG